MRSIRHAARTLLRTPFVTLAAILSLSLGIGANTAIFTMFDHLLRRPLPVPEPERLVNLEAPGPKPGSTSCNEAGPCEVVFSYPMFRDLEREQTVFTGLAAHVNFGANITAQAHTFSGRGELVSGAYFSVLQLQPALGRLLSSADDRVPGEGTAAVVSHAFWRDRFGLSPGIIGQTVTVNGQVLEIVGVAPETFTGTTLNTPPDLYVPITLRERLVPNPARRGPNAFENRRAYWLYLFARLAPGTTIDQARTSLGTTYRAIVANVEAPLQAGMSAATLERFKAKPLVLVAGDQGHSSLRADAGRPLVLLMGVTLLVLLIACANIANLLLARAAARANEMSIRLSLGATRRQLIAQLLTESCLLALIGGLGGLLVAHWTLRLIAASLPPGLESGLIGSIDRVALAFAAAIAVGTGLLFGLFPAIHSTRADLITAMKAHSGQPSGARSASRFRTALATGQIALSTLLLVAAGLFIRSLANVSRVDLGLDTDRIVSFTVSPSLNGYTPERSRDLFVRLEEELRALPGVAAVTASRIAILTGSNWGQSVSVQGFEAGPDTDVDARVNLVGAGYFSALGIPLLAGREFTASDAADAPKVAIVNEAFTRKFNLGRDAVGKRIGERRDPTQRQLDIEIVGVVKDAKYSEVKDAVPPVFVRPYLQETTGTLTYYVRASAASDPVMAAVPRLVHSLDPNLPVDDLILLPEQVRNNVYIDRFLSVLSAAFALLATSLAAVGLYGVLAYTVQQRTREIGLRMALGAAPGTVLRMVLRQVAIMTIAGATAGLVAAFWLGRASESLLFQLNGSDPFVLASAVGSLALVAVVAGALPAIRASRVDPMTALRCD